MAQNSNLHTWIDQHSVSRPKKHLHREFSDAVPVAEILKEHFPKLVDLHNYAPKNALDKKIDNWITLNRRVLKKLDIELKPKHIESLAKSIPGEMEKLLEKIKEKVEEEENKKLEKIQEENLKETKIEVKTVPLDLFEQQANELEMKTEAIEALNKKIAHQQTLLESKESRIEELQKKLEEYIMKANSGLFSRIF